MLLCFASYGEGRCGSEVSLCVVSRDVSSLERVSTIRATSDVTGLTTAGPYAMAWCTLEGKACYGRVFPGTSTLSAMSECDCGPLSATCIACSPDRGEIAVGSEDGTIHITSPHDRRPLRTLVPPTRGSSASCVAITSSAAHVAVGTGSSVFIWDLGSSSISIALGCSSEVQSIDSDGNSLCAGRIDGMADLWDLRFTRQPMASQRSHSSTVWDTRFIRPSSRSLVSCSEDGSVVLWDFRETISKPHLEVIQSFSFGANSVDVEQSLGLVASASDSFDISIISLEPPMI